MELKLKLTSLVNQETKRILRALASAWDGWGGLSPGWSRHFSELIFKVQAQDWTTSRMFMARWLQLKGWTGTWQSILENKEEPKLYHFRHIQGSKFFYQTCKVPVDGSFKQNRSWSAKPKHKQYYTVHFYTTIYTRVLPRIDIQE